MEELQKLIEYLKPLKEIEKPDLATRILMQGIEDLIEKKSKPPLPIAIN